jgi:hypothetical protein
MWASASVAFRANNAGIMEDVRGESAATHRGAHRRAAAESIGTLTPSLERNSAIWLGKNPETLTSAPQTRGVARRRGQWLEILECLNKSAAAIARAGGCC